MIPSPDSDFLDLLLDLTSLQTLSIPSRADLLSIAPDIISFENHKKLATELQKISDKELIGAVIDALGNLSLTKECTVDMVNDMISRINTFSLCDVPVVLNYIIKSVTPETSHSVFRKLIKEIDFESWSTTPSIPLLQPSQLSQQTNNLKGKQKELPKWSEAVIFDTIRSSIRSQTFLKSELLKILDSDFSGLADDESEQINIETGVFILLTLLTSMTTDKKKFYAILLKKVTLLDFPPSLFSHSGVNIIHKHSEGLKQYFPILIQFAEYLLRVGCKSYGDYAGLVAKEIYVGVFLEAENSDRQDIVGCLVAHIGSQSQSEMDTAFDVLLELTQVDAKGISVFSIFIKSLLD
ncbi:Fanconi anemia group D2 protein, partial [Nowakowskiella sp. JEL0407]